MPGPTPRPGQGNLGTPQPGSLQHEAGPRSPAQHAAPGPQHYDPFSFSQQQQAAQPRNIEAGGGARAGDLAPVFGPAPAPVLKHPRPADTKYSPAADPRTFFDNQFHASDRFFDMGQDFDKFQVDTTAADARPAHTSPTHKERKSDLSKERRNLKYNRTKETEKMRSLRSKLFDNREPGGYYIKVFNNDGNNYSIRDGNFHQSGRTPPPPPPPPPSPSPSPAPARRTGGGPGKLWPDQTEFESREVSQHFPFLF